MTISNGYCDIDDIRDELGYDDADSTDDLKLELAVEAASRQIDGWCGQRFWLDSTATARTFIPEDPYYLELYGEGIGTTTGLVVKLDLNDAGTYGTTLTSGTDFLLRPANAAVVSPALPYTALQLTGTNYTFSRSAYGRALVEITAKWGWPAVPADVKKACLILAIDLFKSKDAAFGVAGVADLGVLRVGAGLNRMALALLAPYRLLNVG